jgi:hypothetical protein
LFCSLQAWFFSLYVQLAGLYTHTAADWDFLFFFLVCYVFVLRFFSTRSQGMMVDDDRTNALQRAKKCIRSLL